MASRNTTEMDGSLAAHILASFDESIDDAARPGDSQSNEVWITERVVLRISEGFGPGHLSREARLAAILPADVGYPTILGSGAEDGREWIVAERLLGQNLGSVWPTLTEHDQVRAIASLWERLQVVHATDPDEALAAGCVDTPFYALHRDDATQQLDALRDENAIDEAMHRPLTSLLEEAFDAMDGGARAVCHTDVGLKNAIWDGETAIPIDFEFACVAPSDLDIERWLWELRETSAAARHWRELASEDLTAAGARERITGYRVLRDVWALGIWLRHAESFGTDRPWPPADLHEWRPWTDLADHASGRDPFFQLWPR